METSWENTDSIKVLANHKQSNDKVSICAYLVQEILHNLICSGLPTTKLVPDSSDAMSSA